MVNTIIAMAEIRTYTLTVGNHVFEYSRVASQVYNYVTCGSNPARDAFLGKRVECWLRYIFLGWTLGFVPVCSCSGHYEVKILRKLTGIEIKTDMFENPPSWLIGDSGPKVYPVAFEASEIIIPLPAGKLLQKITLTFHGFMWKDNKLVFNGPNETLVFRLNKHKSEISDVVFKLKREWQDYECPPKGKLKYEYSFSPYIESYIYTPTSFTDSKLVYLVMANIDPIPLRNLSSLYISGGHFSTYKGEVNFVNLTNMPVIVSLSSGELYLQGFPVLSYKFTQVR